MRVVLAKREEEGSGRWKRWRRIRQRVRRLRGLEVSDVDGERVTVVWEEEDVHKREELNSSIGGAEIGLI